jgi:hypothetical protein
MRIFNSVETPLLIDVSANMRDLRVHDGRFSLVTGIVVRAGTRVASTRIDLTPA